MAGSAVPPTRLPRATRVAVREVLLAELISAETRARAAGCPREVLFEALDARLRAAVEEGRDAGLCPPAEDECREPGDAAGAAWQVQPRWVVEDGCREPGDAVGPVWFGQPCRPAEDDRRETGLHHVHPGSAAEDSQDRRHDPVEPGLVGESRG